MKSTIFAFAAVAFALIAVASAYAMTVDRLLLVSDNPADEAVASSIASDINAALVLTPHGTYDEATLNQIINASPRKVIIIGGKAAVPDGYLDELAKAGIEVKVVGGKTRQQTSILAWKEFKSEIKKKTLVVDGKEAIAVSDAVPVYLYDNESEVREFVKDKLNVSVTNQERIRNANFRGVVRNITADMVQDLHAEIAAFKQTENASRIVLKERVRAIIQEHTALIKEALEAKQNQSTAVTGKIIQVQASTGDTVVVE